MRRLWKPKGEDGFTLIELLIVIIVLGILAAIVVFAVGGTTQNATVASCKADAKTVEVAVEAYHATTGAWPTGYGQIITATSTVNNVVQGGSTFPETTTIGPFLHQQPQSTHYVITFDSSGNVLIGPKGGTATATFDATGGTACDVAS